MLHRKSALNPIFMALLTTAFTAQFGENAIEYSLDGINPKERLAHGTVNVKVFEDARKIDSTSRNNSRNYNNAEKGYETGTVGSQVAECLSQHIAKVNIFDTVLFDCETNCRYSLTGTLKKFEGKQITSNDDKENSVMSGAVTGVIGGAVGGAVMGAVVSMTSKIPTEICIGLKILRYMTMRSYFQKI